MFYSNIDQTEFTINTEQNIFKASATSLDAIKPIMWYTLALTLPLDLGLPSGSAYQPLEQYIVAITCVNKFRTRYFSLHKSKISTP